ncbi:MAG: RNA methyltransferase [Kiritimatiellia bacterium]
MGLEQVRIVLVGPLYGGNVGAVCRAMANMGLADLRVVTPSPELDLQEARMMACHAGHVLDGRQIHDDLAAAIADCVLVVGTSGLAGLYRQHARTARGVAPELLSFSENGPVAYVFGREDNGLTTEELALCHRIVQIPSHAETPSLNLGQAVLLCCYELFMVGGDYAPPVEKSPPAESALRERMFSIWYDLLLDIGFMKEDKATHMMQGIRRVMGRGALTKDDVQIMMGVARQMRWAAQNGVGGENLD